MTVIYNVGDLASWLSALGGVGSIGAALWIAIQQQKQSNRLLQEKEAVEHLYQSDIVAQASALADQLLDWINGSALSFSGAEWGEYVETKNVVSQYAERIRLLSEYAVLTPIQKMKIEALMTACSIPDQSIHGSPSSVTHELRILVKRVEAEKEKMASIR